MGCPNSSWAQRWSAVLYCSGRLGITAFGLMMMMMMFPTFVKLETRFYHVVFWPCGCVASFSGELVESVEPILYCTQLYTTVQTGTGSQALGTPSDQYEVLENKGQKRSGSVGRIRNRFSQCTTGNFLILQYLCPTLLFSFDTCFTFEEKCRRNLNSNVTMEIPMWHIYFTI